MHGFISGRIEYHTRGEWSGREHFEMFARADGGRTLRALCKMRDVDLTRDVSMSLDAHSRPLDAFVRLVQRGRVRGSTLFTVRPHELVCDGTLADHGHVRQRHALDAPLEYLGLHPLVGDALVTLVRGCDRPGETRFVAGYTNSSSPDGNEGLLAVRSNIAVTFIGHERRRVPAGEFDAAHHLLRWRPEWPEAHIWTYGPQAIFLELTWALNDSRYVLTTLETEEA
ncbi:MAG: hypothetical protein RL469_1533 [Pseudomonadota bacterium]|nr:hypothetical protein [Gammaproteobacteria bacterium]